MRDQDVFSVFTGEEDGCEYVQIMYSGLWGKHPIEIDRSEVPELIRKLLGFLPE